MGLVAAGLAGKGGLRELRLRGLSFVGPAKLLEAFHGIKAADLQVKRCS